MHKDWLMAIVFILLIFAFRRNPILAFLYYLKRIFFSRDKTIENKGRGHYLLVKQKLTATDRNSQASCAFAELFLPSQWCSQSSPFQSFSCFYSKISRGFTNTAITESTAGRDVIWLFYFWHFTSASPATLTNVFYSSTPLLFLSIARRILRRHYRKHY